MTEAIITTLISSALLLAGNVIAVVASASKTRAEMRQDFEVHKAEIRGAMQLTTSRIDNLSAKVEEHNKVVERVYKLERDIAVLQAQESADRQ